MVGEKIYRQPESFLQYKSSLANVYIVVFIAPLAEELCYRLYLLRSRFTLSVSFFFFFYFLSSLATKSPFYAVLNDTFLLRVSMSLAAVLLININSFSILKKLTNVRLKYFIWFSCLSFALMHLTNFVPLSFYQQLFFPVLIFVQFVYAVVFAFFRLRHGFIWAVLLHVFINATGFAFAYFTNK
ncbi:type II CAAX prenyl endopeptidase Rce1 family protein [Maribacter sp. 2307ULW6-5]|uniref:CPBP family glutamic-type intramembrane protease n=1 Tax=Maribacter sp. 2307ULW6-5 TaxID=3386275 RepID=UPI0039BC8D69